MRTTTTQQAVLKTSPLSLYSDVFLSDRRILSLFSQLVDIIFSQLWQLSKPLFGWKARVQRLGRYLENGFPLFHYYYEKKRTVVEQEFMTRLERANWTAVTGRKQPTLWTFTTGRVTDKFFSIPRTTASGLIERETVVSTCLLKMDLS